MTRPAPRPALTPSARSGRQWLLAAGLSALCLALGLLIFLIAFGMTLEEFHDDPPMGLVVLAQVDALLGLLTTLAVGPLRFLRPGRLHTAAHLLLAAIAGWSSWSLPAVAIALYRLGLQRKVLVTTAAVLLTTGSSAALLAVDTQLRGGGLGSDELLAVGVMAVLALIPLLIGQVVGTRHALLESLRERADAAERERETARRQAEAAAGEAAALVRERDAVLARVRAEERAALARDMHDSISHHLSTIAMHAGAMSFREDLSPTAMRSAAGTVRDAAQQANRELRTVLTSLRTVEDDAPLPTVPTLCEIVERCRAEGQQVTLRWEDLTAEELAAHDRSHVVTLARILSEVALNAAKHAPGAPLTVTLGRSDDHVHLLARSPLPDLPVAAPSTGHGLLGVQERARLLGGDSLHGTVDGHFEVEAWIPW